MGLTGAEEGFFEPSTPRGASQLGKWHPEPLLGTMNDLGREEACRHLFVDHFGSSHPDPEMEQLNVLKAACRKLLRGETALDLHWTLALRCAADRAGLPKAHRFTLGFNGFRVVAVDGAG